MAIKQTSTDLVNYELGSGVLPSAKLIFTTLFLASSALGIVNIKMPFLSSVRQDQRSGGAELEVRKSGRAKPKVKSQN